MKNIKRFLSLLLALVMASGLILPAAFTARAEGEPDPLDGKTFAIVNGKNQAAMTAELNADSGNLNSLAVSTDGDQLICSTSADKAKICVWTFQQVPNETSKYYIYTGDGENARYLKIEPNTPVYSGCSGNLVLTDEINNASQFQAVQTGSRYVITASCTASNGTSYDIAISSDSSKGIFGGWSGNGVTEQQILCEESAIITPTPGTKVEGVSPLGTTIDIFDYWVTNEIENDGDSNGLPLTTGDNATSGINEHSSLKFTTAGPGAYKSNINVWTGSNGGLFQGIVQPTLVNGFPVLAAGLNTGLTAPAETEEKSLDYLFNDVPIENAKTVYTNAQGLFRVNQAGYYYFDSKRTAAQLETDPHSEAYKKFTLYDLPAETECLGFFPFDTATPEGKGYLGQNGNPATNGKSNDLNHFFGAHMTTQFIQSADGRTDLGQDVTYEFTGDDDVWIFIDGVLVGDVGGIHDAAGVTINFATGAVTYDNAAGADASTIFEQYSNAASAQIQYFKAATLSDGTLVKGDATDEENAEFADITVNDNTYTFKKAGGNWIFADGTYHTLDFFYLERGGGLSNMKLQFNLEEIPPTYIKKVDQDGEPISGVQFQLSVVKPVIGGGRDSLLDYEWTSGNPTEVVKTVATGETNTDGSLTLLYSSEMGSKAGKLVSLADLYTSYYDNIVGTVISSGGLEYHNALLLELEETNSAELNDKGYRTLGKISLRLERINGTYILRSNDRWNNGVYATPNVIIRAPEEVTLQDGKTAKLSDEKYQGKVGMFAVVLGWLGDTPPQSQDDIGKMSNWGLVHGSDEEGWQITRVLQTGEDDGEYAARLGYLIGQYAKENGGSLDGLAYRFTPAASGSYNATIPDLPGEIDSYYFMLADSNGDLAHTDDISKVKFATGFYVSEAEDFTTMTGALTKRVNHRASSFERDFGATVNVPNIENRLIVQRLDGVGNTVPGAKFALYGDGSVDVGADGTLTLKPGAAPLQTVITTDLEKDLNSVSETSPKARDHSFINVKGAAVFGHLASGVYYLVETEPPFGYAPNKEIVKVIVDADGVHAYAGDPCDYDIATQEGIDNTKGIPYGDYDGISVLIGPGSLVNTMSNFGSAGDVDNTLTDIYALRATAKNADGTFAGRDVSAAELSQLWQEVSSRGNINLQRKWRVYSPDAALEYVYATGSDALGKTNELSETENPSGYVSASGWNWDLLTQNYYGIYDQGKNYSDVLENLTDAEKIMIAQETSKKTPLPTVAANENDLNIRNGYTSFGNKILTGLFSGSTMVRFASRAQTSLSISKVVNTAARVAPENASFPFDLSFTYVPQAFYPDKNRTELHVGDIDLPDPVLVGEYPYAVTKDGAEVETGTLTIAADPSGLDTSGEVTADTRHYVSAVVPTNSGAHFIQEAGKQGLTLTLAAGETLTISGLPVGATYTVTEQEVLPYTTTAKINSNDVQESRTATATLTTPGQADAVTYTNTYTPGEAEIIVKKDLVGREWKDGETFEFTLTGTNGSVTTNETVTAASADKAAAFTLSNLDDGTYIYTLRENPGSLGGVQYDGTVYEITVTVTGGVADVSYREVTPGENGAVTYGDVVKDSTVTFTNTYAPTPATLALKVSKTWTPALTARLRGDTAFSAVFQIEADADNPDGAALPGQTQITVMDTAADGTHAGSGSFGSITFTKAGTYTFKVSEVMSAGSGMTCTPAYYTVTVTVTDDGNGMLTAAAAYKADGGAETGYDPDTGLPFTNTYVPKGSVTVEYYYVDGMTATLLTTDPTGQLNPFAAAVGAEWRVKVAVTPDAAANYTAPSTITIQVGEQRYAYAPNRTQVFTRTDGSAETEVTDAVKGDGTISGTIAAEDQNVVVKLYYVLEENPTKELSYTVEYYKDGVLVGDDTQVVTKTVPASEPNTLSVDKGSINTVDKYTGYRFEKTDPETIPDAIENGGVIKVYYVKTDPGPGPDDPTPEPNIAVVKTLALVNGLPYGGGAVNLYDLLTYEITVTNTGNVALNVTLSDILPAGLASADPQSWTFPLAAGAGETRWFTAQAAAAGSFVNTAVAVGTTDDGKQVTDADDAAVWVQQPYIPPVDPGPVTPPEDLNAKDHVAYIIGYPDGTVRPDGPITRAEVATIFFRLLTDEARETYWCQVNSYTDVPYDGWYNNAISTLSNMGIISGYPDGSFRPDAAITRAELTKIAVSFFQYADQYFGYLGNFTDVTGNEWYASFVAAASALGLIEGYPDGTFRPDAAITRAETCTIVNRTLGRKPHRNHLLPWEIMITWPDNQAPVVWYYAQIQEATNSHDYLWTFVPEGWETVEAEEWTAKLPERDWAALERVWSTAHSAPGGEVMG